jgi:hypothetical protein
MKSKFMIHPAFLLIIIFCISIVSTTTGQDFKRSKLPSGIQFNGLLTDKTGNVLPNDSYNFTFFIYDSPDSKIPLWKEYHKDILVNNGGFQISLGKDIESSPLNLTFDKKYYIGIKINDDEEMLQRLEFGIAPYSLGARYAESVKDGSITSEKFADNSVTNDKIKSLSVNKITDLPGTIGTVQNLKNIYGITGSDYEWWTTFGNIIYGPERHFIGTRNDRDFVIVTNEIQRMLFDPHGYILLGTVANPVDFEVFGMSTFDYMYVQGNLGVGVDPALAKMHIDSPLGKIPFRIDYQNNQIFGIDTKGRVTVKSTVGGSDSEIENYPFYVSGGDHGVGIKIDGTANGNMNYVSFWDANGMVGRIEGQTAAEYAAQPASIATDVYLAALIAAEIVAAASYLYPLPIPTEPADIIRDAADIAEMTFDMIWDLTHTGITYESGSGDYAEWLERGNESELMIPGDIVAVNGGKISKNTSHAEQFMAISTSPIILGNMPEKKNEQSFEKVAFMGQIPVNVRGIVSKGDYIIPSGLNDGTGLAVSPEQMTVDEYSKIVGRAWSSSNDESVKQINILVGIYSNDIGKLLKKLELEENRLTANNNLEGEPISKLSIATKTLKTNFKDLEIKLTNLLQEYHKK